MAALGAKGDSRSWNTSKATVLRIFDDVLKGLQDSAGSAGSKDATKILPTSFDQLSETDA